MKMKKLLIILLTLCFVFALAISCVQPPPPPPPPPPDPPPPPPAVTIPPPPQTINLDGIDFYTVARGDTLSSIAIKQYGTGNGYYYPLIALASKLGRINNVNVDVVEDIDLIEPGMVLAIPDLQRNLDNAVARRIIKTYMGGEVADINDARGRAGDAAELRKLADSLYEPVVTCICGDAPYVGREGLFGN
jgi:LysM repeat protein